MDRSEGLVPSEERKSPTSRAVRQKRLMHVIAPIAVSKTLHDYRPS